MRKKVFFHNDERVRDEKCDGWLAKIENECYKFDVGWKW
jgi:hypothetical protein